MKLLMLCIQCAQEDPNPLKEFMEVEIRDDGLYKVTCAKGHTFVTWLQSQKFEILFDMAAMALLDGYSREAVSSIASSLERFYEFYIKVILLKHGVNFEEFMKTWKYVSNQSERQLGAFLFLYLLENKTGLQPIDPEFRNKIIHKGYIPLYDEVVEYGDHVYQFIVKLLKELKATSGDYFWKVITQNQNKMHSEEHDGLSKGTMFISTIISHTDGELGSRTFKQSLDELKLYRRHKYT